MIKLIFPITLLAIAIIAQSCGENNPKQEDLALNAARKFFEVTDVSVEDSKRLYLHYCAICHGDQGKGDGFNSYNLDPKPKSFADSTFLKKADSAYVLNVIEGGGKAVGISAFMPPYGRTLTYEEIEKLAEYVMLLSKQSTD